VFGIMDRIAPGRIKVVPNKCQSCAVCTGVCSSHVRVHEEIARFGSVVDPSCLKDLDCVTACPEQALSFGWTRPSLMRSLRAGRRKLRYDFTLGEDVLMAAVFVASLVIFRGLYGIVPFLLVLAVGGILAYLAVLLTRLWRSENVRLNGFQLKFKGRITRAGGMFAVLSIVLWMFVVHSGLIRRHEVLGQRALASALTLFGQGAGADDVRAASGEALGHLQFIERWGLMTAPGHYRRAASAYWGVGDVEGAEKAWRRAIEVSPRDLESPLDLAASLVGRGRPDLAQPVLQKMCEIRDRHEKDTPIFASALYNLGVIEENLGWPDDAIGRYREAARLNPANANAHFSLGRLLMQTDDKTEGTEHLQRAADLDPRYR